MFALSENQRISQIFYGADSAGKASVRSAARTSTRKTLGWVKALFFFPVRESKNFFLDKNLFDKRKKKFLNFHLFRF